jgi:hypothetical protein
VSKRQYTLKELEQRLAFGEDDELPLETRQDVVEYLEREIRYQQARGCDTITVAMPVEAADLLARCARDGMRKGQGKGGVRDERITELQKLNILLWAKQIKKKLMKPDKPKSAEDAKDTSIKKPMTADKPKSAKDAEVIAIKQARKSGIERFNIDMAANTMRRALGWRD